MVYNSEYKLMMYVGMSIAIYIQHEKKIEFVFLTRKSFVSLIVRDKNYNDYAKQAFGMVLKKLYLNQFVLKLLKMNLTVLERIYLQPYAS